MSKKISSKLKMNQWSKYIHFVFLYNSCRKLQYLASHLLFSRLADYSNTFKPQAKVTHIYTEHCSLFKYWGSILPRLESPVNSACMSSNCDRKLEYSHTATGSTFTLHIEKLLETRDWPAEPNQETCQKHRSISQSSHLFSYQIVFQHTLYGQKYWVTLGLSPWIQVFSVPLLPFDVTNPLAMLSALTNFVKEWVILKSSLNLSEVP